MKTDNQQEVPIELLKPNPWNTNKLTPERESQLEASIARLGVFKPIIVRENDDGDLEIIGGEHRWEAACRLGYNTVPIFNVGKIPEEKAKEIGIIDNGRYGADDTRDFADLLQGLDIDTKELALFMPMSIEEIEAILIDTEDDIDIDDVDLDDDTDISDPEEFVSEKQFQLIRFKVPAADYAMVQAVIERIMEENDLKDDDSLTNAGHALVELAKGY